MTDNESKPCPFCGHIDLAIVNLGREYYMRCKQCNAYGPYHQGSCVSKKTASIAWNTRPIEDKLQAEIKRLRGQMQNCVNHLELLKRHAYRSDESKINACVESANKALYETS